MTRNLLKACLIILLIPTIHVSCSKKHEPSLMPEGYEKADALTIEHGNLRVVFADNAALAPDHKAGYNGIAKLYHNEVDSTVFVPTYAGFNLEHIFGGDSLEQLFEPRKHPMTLFRKNDNAVLLYQASTPLSGVESLTEFRLVEPHYIDITFTCIFHDLAFFKHGYAGLFWASYIQNPTDRKIYFKGVTESNADEIAWIGASSEKHGVNSTHINTEDKHAFFFAPNFNASLANHFSEYRYIEPYYFGRLGKMVLAYFFDTEEVIRFSQSPNGGGEFSPAWDFQYLVPEPQKGKRYGFHARMVYKPFENENDISTEYDKWIKEK